MEEGCAQADAGHPSPQSTSPWMNSEDCASYWNGDCRHEIGERRQMTRHDATTER